MAYNLSHFVTVTLVTILSPHPHTHTPTHIHTPYDFTLSVQSDLLKISQCHFSTMSVLLTEGIIQPPSSETQPPHHKHMGAVSPLKS